jgi:hypothetical protein
MRGLLPLAVLTAAMTTGCATNRCTHSARCCGPTVAAQTQAPEAIRPAPESPPAEPGEAAPAAPEATHVPLDAEPATEPVSTGGDDYAVYGHDPRHRWLVGRLERLGGAWWRLHYVPEAGNRPGKSIVLAPDIRLDEYAQGDFVYVQGETVADTQSPRGPLYRVRIIRPATGSDRQRVAAW